MILWYVVCFLCGLFGFWVGIMYGYYLCVNDYNITDITPRRDK